VAQGFKYWNWGSGFRVHGLEFGFKDSGLKVKGLGFRVFLGLELGFGV